MTKALWVALTVVAAVAAVVLLLFTGGGPSTPGRDAAGDVSVATEGDPPKETALADLLASDVTLSDGEAVFEATLGSQVPKKIDDGSLELRWDVVVDGTDSWIVQVNINLGVNAAITSHQTDYGSSTIDETLPGDVAVEGDRITLTIETDRIKGFPTDLRWRLTSTLDGALGDTSSALATDSLPDSGTNEVGPS